MNVSLGSVLKYSLLPRLLPRLRDVVQDGFGFIAFSIACVFETARLLPAGHPYTNTANIGQFGLVHVLAQAAANLQPNLRHIDQIAVFGLIVAGLAILAAQIGVLVLSLFVQTAGAAAFPAGFNGFFVTANPQQDIAFMLLDRVFGIPDFFNSCVAQNLPCFPKPTDPNPISSGVFPFPYHYGLQAMLSFYSYGLLLIAALVFCYYVFSIIAETAVSGTAFGKRFNRVWAPVRLIVALGLLIPMTNGLNASQYIVLQVAKWGSSLGTNGWVYFMGSLGGNGATPLGAVNSLVGRPQYPDANDVLQFMALAWTCEMAYEEMYVADPGTQNGIDIRAWFVKSGFGQPAERLAVTDADNMTFEEISQWFGYGDIVVVFGDFEPDEPEKYKEYLGGVRPYCGEMTLPIRKGRIPGGADTPLEEMAYLYFENLIYNPWVDPNAGGSINFEDMATAIIRRTLPINHDPNAALPTEDQKAAQLATFNQIIRVIVDNGFAGMQAYNDPWVNTALPYGWAGAGIWYNKVAEVNGDFTEAVANIPVPSKYPELMEYVLTEKSKNSSAVAGAARFEPQLANNEEIHFKDEKEKDIIRAMNKTYVIWDNFFEITRPAQTGNSFIDGVNTIFQKSGLWSFRQNETQHPMAALVVLGKSLILKSIATYAVGASGGALAGIFGGKGMTTQISKNLASILVTVTFIALVAGILLNYVVPFLPFVYFIFAVMGWIKTIFEAMVGIPLWALAHLSYTGDGFPTSRAMQGYFLLVDIFLRPIFIVFGLIGSSILFYALARTMNNIFTIVVSNVSGFDEPAAANAAAGTIGNLAMMRNAIDQIFFTIMYAVIIYMMGLSCFKMIDQVPNHVMRWMGSSAKSFAGIVKEDAGDSLRQMSKQGAYTTQDQVSGLTGEVTGRRSQTDSPDD